MQERQTSSRAFVPKRRFTKLGLIGKNWLASTAIPAADLRSDGLAWEELQQGIQNHAGTSPDSTRCQGKLLRLERISDTTH